MTSEHTLYVVVPHDGTGVPVCGYVSYFDVFYVVREKSLVFCVVGFHLTARNYCPVYYVHVSFHSFFLR